MFISPTEAVKIYDVSKPTLYKDMTEGRLSFTKDDRNRRKINVAELDRLYSKRRDASETFTSGNGNLTEGLTNLNVNSKAISKEIQTLVQQGKDREIELLQQQIEQYKAQVENLNQNLAETREEHRSYVRLLEDKRDEQGAKTSRWEEKFLAMEQKMSSLQNQNKKLMRREEIRKQRIEERRRQREAEKEQKSSNFFSRLFG